MRAIVCGGRYFSDKKRLDDALDAFDDQHIISLVIQGEARGADTLAKIWALRRGISVESYPADWATFGLGAGHRRNRTMLLRGKPDVVIAFPGGPGTANMLKQARARGVWSIEVFPGEEA